MTEAWYTASIPHLRGGWPTLAKLLGEDKPVQPQTNEQLLQVMQSWAKSTNRSE